MTNDKTTQHLLFEKTNLLKNLQPKIKIANTKRINFALCGGIAMLSGLAVSLFTGHTVDGHTHFNMLPTAIGSIVGFGLLATSGYFQFLENKTKKEYERINNEIQNLRDFDMAKGLEKDNHVIRQFKRF